MELLNQIRKDQLQARKDRNTVKKNLLTTLIGEADLQASKAKGMGTLDLVKKFLKDLRTTIAATDAINADALLEVDILEAYLPTQMDEEAIARAISESGATNMGEAMKFLKATLNGQYDGKLASTVAKGMF